MKQEFRNVNNFKKFILSEAVNYKPRLLVVICYCNFSRYSLFQRHMYKSVHCKTLKSLRNDSYQEKYLNFRFSGSSKNYKKG